MTTIVTHSGLFHADDVFACAALGILFPDANVIRTRDPSVIATASIAVDVGGECNPAKGRFDHHQKGRAGARPNGILYSSFGLVWREYGSLVCRTALGSSAALGPLPRRLPGWSEEIAAAVDVALVQSVDATDNGQALRLGGERPFGDVRNLGVSGAISALNPSWWETEDFAARFSRAKSIATDILRGVIAEEYGRELARGLVHAALDAAEGPIVVLDQFCPWQDVVLERAPNALFVVFPSEEGTWMVQAVPKAAGSFEQRLPLPERWAGLRDTAFQAETGVEDGVFCHPGRFICGARSKSSALRLAELALR